MNKDSPEARALEAAGLSFLLVTPTGECRYCSEGAREILGLTRECKTTEVVSSLLASLPLYSAKPFIQEHHVRNSWGHTVALTVTVTAISDEIRLVLLDALSDSLPLLEHVERHHKLRPLVVLLAASLGIHDDLVRISHRVLDQHIPCARELFPPQSSESAVVSDLQHILTRAVSICDVFLPSTIKLSVDSKRSALLDIPSTAAVRILCHAILEAAAFTAGQGDLRLRSVLGLGKRVNDETTIEVVLIAERHHFSTTTTRNWLVQSLLRRTQHQPRRIRVSDDEPVVKQLQSGEGLVSGSPNPEREISRGQNASALPEGGESADLSILKRLGQEHDVTIQLTSPDPDILACYLSFPLSTAALAPVPPGR